MNDVAGTGRTTSDGEPRPLAESLQALGETIGLGDLASQSTLRDRWHEVVGETIALHTEPLSLSAGILTVAVQEPAWATEIRFSSTAISQRASDLLGAGAVREIRVVVRPKNGG